MVGVSGNAARRTGLMAASTRERPDLMCGCCGVSASNMSCTCPPATSAAPGALPLYGTCWIGAPVTVLKSSPTRCGAPPDPDDAKLILPGLALASAITSATDFAGTCALITISMGIVAYRHIGT